MFKLWPTQSYVQPAIFIAAFVFLIGGLIALKNGFFVRYLETPQTAALALAIGWVFGWGAWSTDALRTLPAEIQPALRSPEDASYEALAERFHQRVYLAWPNFVLGGILFLLVLWRLEHDSDWLSLLPSAWAAEGDVRSERIILAFYFAIGAPLFVTMLWGFAHFVGFTRSALTYPLVLAPNLARTHLRPLAGFGLKTGAGWSVAVTLVAAFFARDLTSGVLTMLFVLAFLGIALITLPQVFAHFALNRARDELVVATAAALRAEQPGSWVDQYVVHADEAAQRARAFLGELHQVPVWIHSPGEALILLVEVLVPVVTLVLAQQ